MKKNTFHILAFTTCIILSGNLKAFSQTGGQKAFTGTWTINYDKSDFGQIPHYVISKNISLSINPKNIVLKLIMTSPSGIDSTVNETLQLGGKMTEIVGDDKRKKTITADISANGDTLKVNTVASVPGNSAIEQYKINETWTTIKNGQFLVIKKTVLPSVEGTTYSVIAIYNRE